MPILESLFIFCLLIIIFSGSQQIYNALVKNHAPFVFSRRRALKKIIEKIKLSDKQVFYELGSGTAPLLRRLANRYPQNEFVGIEYALIPWLAGKLLCLPYRNIKIKKQNFWQSDLREANYIYCFLNVSVMKSLEKKLTTETKDGVIIISYIFKLPNTKTFEAIEIDQEKIYFYKINKLDN